MEAWTLERSRIDRINAKIQQKKKTSHSDVYKQMHRDINEVCYRFRVGYSELVSGSRASEVADAKSVISMIALERLRPLGISDGDIAKHIGLKRTTMLAAAERWVRMNQGEQWARHQEKKESGTNDSLQRRSRESLESQHQELHSTPE